MTDYGIYHTDKYTAYFYPKTIVICTNRQSFRITADRYNTHFLDMLTMKIIKGKVQRLDELRDYSGSLIYSNCSKPKL